MAQKIGIVVPRYGQEITSGAGYHARLIAEMLRSAYQIEVFTTSAIDESTWAHYYQNPLEMVNGIPVNRFEAKKMGDPLLFARIQDIIDHEEHSLEDELVWLEEQGPYVPHLLDMLARRTGEFDYFMFFSYRHYPSYHGVKRFRERSLLVPDTGLEQSLYMWIFKEFFHWPGAIVYNSIEEYQLISRVTGNSQILGEIVGMTVQAPATFAIAQTQAECALTGPYCIYIGDAANGDGVPHMLDYFTRAQTDLALELDLVVLGDTPGKLPAHPHIHYIDPDLTARKWNLLAGAEFALCPSMHIPLPHPALDAWAAGVPVVANGRSEFLLGQCRRSNAGLWYSEYAEFKEIVAVLHQDSDCRQKLGENGRRFIASTYSWHAIKRKYTQLIALLDEKKAAATALAGPVT